jgi:hypothetical protein
MKNKNQTLPWGQKEKIEWIEEQTIKRSYQYEVVTKIMLISICMKQLILTILSLELLLKKEMRSR